MTAAGNRSALLRYDSVILSHRRVSAYSFDNMSRQILFLVFLSAKNIYLKITGKPVQPFGFYELLPSLMRLLCKKRPNRSVLYYSHPIYVKHLGPFHVFYSVPVAVRIYSLRSRVNVFFVSDPALPRIVAILWKQASILCLAVERSWSQSHFR